MWSLAGTTTDGRRTEVPFVEIDTLVSRDQVLNAARSLAEQRGEPAPLAMLAREMGSEDPLPGIDGIESWGANAVDLIGVTPDVSGFQLGRVLETERGQEVLGLTWFEAGSPGAQAFHWPKVIVADASGLEEIVFTESDSTLLEVLEPFTRYARFLEWRAYFGTGTLVAEGESEFDVLPTPKGPVKTTRIRLLGGPATLIGRALDWMGRPIQPSVDRFRNGRQKHYQKKLPAVAEAYPDLEAISMAPERFFAEHGEPKGEPTLVFVHGTFSCSLPHLALLHPLAIKTFRFEHDTFRSISDNAMLLVDAVRRYLKPDPLYIVAHSRGGLVARLAARELTTTGLRVVVRTYGTPHRGTPLANAGGKLLSALLAMGRTAAAGMFAWDPASLAGKLALKALCWSSRLPEGLEVMRTDSETLKSWGFGQEPFELISYGGNYDLRVLAEGACAYAIGEIAHQAFARQQNDFVVPTQSALGAGKPRPVLNPCDHFHYFSIEALRQELQGL